VRKFVIGAVVLATALITASIALGTTTRQFTQFFTNSNSATGAKVTKKNTATGVYFFERSEDPANTDNNKQPIQDDVDTMIFPAGAVINQAAAPQCGATDQDFSQKGDKACPAKSNVGTGAAKVRVPFNGQPDINAGVKLFNGKKKQLIAYVTPTIGQPVVLRTVISGKAGKTQKLTITVPLTCLIGTPPNCKDARIVELSLFIKKTIANVKKKGKTIKIPLLTTPKKCPASKKWTFTFTFHHRDGSGQETRTSDSPCK
jgi:hypothetical protein